MTELNTDRLLLRDFLRSDWTSVHEYAGDREVVQLLEWGPNDEDQTKGFVRDSLDSQKQRPRTTYDMAVIHKQDAKLIGACGIVILDTKKKEASIGYVFNRKYWGQGFASEAALRMVRFGLDELKLDRVTATCDTENIASRRVLEKAGLVLTEHLKANREVKGRIRDTFCFEIVANK
ncbi:MAG TPA: GNAT family N-acetyltransferase [Chroococcales cyanobacterium]